MSTYGHLEDIESKLQAFVKDIEALNTNPTAGHEEPSTVIYGQTTLEALWNHHKVQDIEIVHDRNVYFKECEVLLRGNLRRGVLFRTTVHNSTLYDCILIECTIYGSKVELSTLEDCRVRKKAIDTSDTTSETPFISCCQIENTTFYDSEIFNSTINGGLQIQHSKIENTLAVDSLIIGSALKQCGVNSSELHDCQATKCFLTESVLEVKNVLTLRKFQAEVREMIYTYFMRKNEQDDNLVAALRTDPLLHSEVLGIYFKEHVFQLSAENHDVFSSTAPQIIQRMCKLHLK
jgi:hypothetical protein